MSPYPYIALGIHTQILVKNLQDMRLSHVCIFYMSKPDTGERTSQNCTRTIQPNQYNQM